VYGSIAKGERHAALMPPPAANGRHGRVVDV
jgi:hypothetical protein